MINCILCAVPPHQDGIGCVNDSINAQNAGNEFEFLLGIFSGMDPEVIRTVLDNADGDATAAFGILQDMSGGDHSNAVLQVCFVWTY